MGSHGGGYGWTGENRAFYGFVVSSKFCSFLCLKLSVRAGDVARLTEYLPRVVHGALDSISGIM